MPRQEETEPHSYICVFVILATAVILPMYSIATEVLKTESV